MVITISLNPMTPTFPQVMFWQACGRTLHHLTFFGKFTRDSQIFILIPQRFNTPFDCTNFRQSNATNPVFD